MQRANEARSLSLQLWCVVSGQSRGTADGRPSDSGALECGSAATALPPSQKLASDARLATMLQKAAAPQPHSRALHFARRKCPDSRVPQGRAAPLPSVRHLAQRGRLQPAITQSPIGNGMGGPALRDRQADLSRYNREGVLLRGFVQFLLAPDSLTPDPCLSVPSSRCPRERSRWERRVAGEIKPDSNGRGSCGPQGSRAGGCHGGQQSPSTR